MKNMTQQNEGDEAPQRQPGEINDKALRILANSIYSNLRNEGCENKDIIGVSSQLIGLVTASISMTDETE